MTKMHPNELTIDAALVNALLQHQCPQWAHLPLTTIPSTGTDHALFRLGCDYLVRLPRIDWAVTSIDQEYELLPQIATYLTTPIFTPMFKGHATSVYPWPWLIAKWHEGHNPEAEKTNEYAALAQDLAGFLNQFHAIPLTSGPASRRGVPLSHLNADTQKAINQLRGEIDVLAVMDLWHELMATPQWQQKSVWVHGDFLPGNILVQHNRLSAVIDFTDLGVGDPACDLVIAWSLLNSQSRNLFRNCLAHVDHNTWARGKAWALSIALIMLPYYKNSSPALAQLARRMINQVLSDQDEQ